MALALVAFAAAALLLVVAVAWPLIAFDDNAEALSDRQVQRLKGEAHHWSSIPPLRLQISAVDSIPTQRDELADGTITWHTVFGIPYGETRFADQQSEQEWHNARLLWPLGGLFATEAALLAFGVWGLYSDP